MDKAPNDSAAVNLPTSVIAQVNKARVIERSLLLFNLSWLGFVPLLGVAPALVALWLHFKIRKELNWAWNPALKYEFVGVITAYLSLAVTLVMWVFVIFQLFKANSGD